MSTKLALDLLRSLNFQPKDHLSAFIAVKFIRRYGLGTSGPLSAFKLCKDLSVPRIRNYEQLHFLNKEKQYWTSQSTYIFSIRKEILTAQHNHYYKEIGRQPNLVGDLLVWSKNDSAISPHTKLTIPLRMVLLVLLANSSESGIVSNIRKSEIAIRSGRSLKNIEKDIEKLRELGYLGNTFYKNRNPNLGSSTEIYFVNKRHPNYGNNTMKGITYWVSLGVVNDDPIQQVLADAATVKTTSKKHTKSKTHHSPHAIAIAALADGPIVTGDLIHLQWLVAEIASGLVKKCIDTSNDKPELDSFINKLCEAETINETIRKCECILKVPKEELDEEVEEEELLYKWLERIIQSPGLTNIPEFIPQRATKNENHIVYFYTFLVRLVSASAFELAAYALKSLSDINFSDFRNNSVLVIPAPIFDRNRNHLIIDTSSNRNKEARHRVFHQFIEFDVKTLNLGNSTYKDINKLEAHRSKLILKEVHKILGPSKYQSDL